MDEFLTAFTAVLIFGVGAWVWQIGPRLGSPENCSERQVCG